MTDHDRPNTSPNPITLDELKTSTLERHLSIAKTSLSLGKRWAGNSVSGLFLSKEAKAARKQAFMQEQADYLATELGKLKGSVVKIGQMLALYGEHILPPEITHALQNLNDNTPAISWTVMEQILQQNLGSRLLDLDIDPTPIGTASLAQVHQATLKKTGTKIALKIQYPNVASSIDADLTLFKQILKVTNAIPQTKALDEWFEEIRDLLHHEVNYPLEAAATQRFYQRLKDDPRYIVPKIIPEYCTPKILCMTYESGIAITDPILQDLPQIHRDRIGQSAIDIMLQEIFVWGEMQTDPNFGNYLVRLGETTSDFDAPITPTDQLILLDFGAIRHFDNHLLGLAKRFFWAGYHHDKAAMILALQNSGYPFFDTMSNKVRSDMADLFLLATEPFSDPKKNPHIPAHCLDDSGHYLWANSQLHSRLLAVTRRAVQSKEFSVPPKELMFISRKFIGAYTFLTVLKARTQADQLMQGFLDNA